jgi:ankyrin repeat protein
MENIFSSFQIQQIKIQSLFEFCKNGDEFKAAELIQQNIPINISDNENKTPVFYALANKHYNLAKSLLIAGSDPNHSIDSENNLLIYFIQQQDLLACEILLIAGANVNWYNSAGKTPLIIALEQDSKELVDLLLKYNVDLNFFSKNSDESLIMTPLMFFTAKGETKTIMILLSLGVKVNKQNPHGLSALAIAALTNNLSAAKLLIQAKANPQTVTNSPKLWELIRKNSKQEVIALIE